MRRTLVTLERAGLIATDRTRGRTSNQFTLMVPSMPSNPGQNARVEPGPSRPDPADPTRAKMVANPGQLAPLTLKNTLGDAKASPNVGEREQCANAPAGPHVGGRLEGAPTKESKTASEGRQEEKNGADGAVEAAPKSGGSGAPSSHRMTMVVPDAFAQLRAIWVRPWPDHDDREARAAFNEAVRGGHSTVPHPCRCRRMGRGRRRAAVLAEAIRLVDRPMLGARAAQEARPRRKWLPPASDLQQQPPADRCGMYARAGRRIRCEGSDGGDPMNAPRQHHHHRHGNRDNISAIGAGNSEKDGQVASLQVARRMVRWVCRSTRRDHQNISRVARGAKKQAAAFGNAAGPRGHRTSEYDEKLLAKCRAWLKEINRDDYYEDDDELEDLLKHKVVAARLALLVGSKPIAGSIEPKAFSRSLLEHVCNDDEADYMALEGACREAEAELKFAPDPSEFLPLLHKHAGLWRARRNALYSLKADIADLIELTEQIERDAVIPKAEQKVREARSTLNSRRESLERNKAHAISKQEAAAKAHVDVEIAMINVKMTAKAVADADEKLALAVSAREAAEAAVNKSKPEA